MVVLLKYFLIISVGFVCNIQCFNDENSKNLETVYNKELCNNQLKNFWQEIASGHVWAIKAFDAWGKIPSGILSGNLIELGSYDQCVEISHTGDTIEQSFYSQYCFADVTINLPISAVHNELGKYFHLKKTNSFSRSADFQNGTKLTYTIGICIPDTCSSDTIPELRDMFKHDIAGSSSISIPKIQKCKKNESVVYSSMDIFAICLFSFIGAMLVGSTSYDLIMTKLNKPKKTALMAFSIYTNGEKLFQCNRNNSSGQIMDCLNGIRVLSMLWVVLGHTYQLFVETNTANLVSLLTWIETPFAMLLIGAPFSVDSFLLLSGLLISWTMLKHLDTHKGKINIPLLYFHRYLRLTPPFAAIVLLHATLYRHISSGPFWGDGRKEANCMKYWWSALLYVQNYVNPADICIRPSWYLSVDMQLFLLSPFIVYPLWRWRNKFVWVIPIIILLSMSCTFTIYMVNGYNNKKLLEFLNASDDGKNRKTYVTTHTRIGAWAIGILLGYVMHNFRGRNVILSKRFTLCSWILSIGSIFAIIFSVLPMNRPDAPVIVIDSAFYEPLSRVAWAIALAWIIFACVHGYGGPINWFLSLPQWQPLARLSYSIYLGHTAVVGFTADSAHTLLYFSDYNAIQQFWSILAISIGVSLFLTLGFESPVIILEKILLSCTNKTKKLTNKNLITKS